MWNFVLDLLKVLIPAGIAIFAALTGWRWQIVGKRRFELAERLLLQFNHAADIIQNTRLSESHSNEGTTRDRAEGEPDNLTRLKDSYWVPIDRINKKIEVFAEARENELIARYFFGPEAEKCFQTIKESVDKVVIASRMLITTVRREGEPPPPQDLIERQYQWMRDIWGTYDANDLIHMEINNARAKLETILTPELKKSAKWWPF